MSSNKKPVVFLPPPARMNPIRLVWAIRRAFLERRYHWQRRRLDRIAGQGLREQEAEQRLEELNSIGRAEARVALEDLINVHSEIRSLRRDNIALAEEVGKLRAELAACRADLAVITARPPPGYGRKLH